MVTAIGLATSRTAIGGVGGEERAPIADLLDRLRRALEAGGSGQCARFWSPRAAGGGARLAQRPCTLGGRLEDGWVGTWPRMGRLGRVLHSEKKRM